MMLKLNTAPLVAASQALHRQAVEGGGVSNSPSDSSGGVQVPDAIMPPTLILTHPSLTDQPTDQLIDRSTHRLSDPFWTAEGRGIQVPDTSHAFQ